MTIEQEIVTVASVADAIEAHMLKDALEAAGIAAYVPSDSSVRWLPLQPGGMPVQVLAADEAEARRIIAEIPPADVVFEDEDDEDDQAPTELDDESPTHNEK